MAQRTQSLTPGNRFSDPAAPGLASTRENSYKQEMVIVGVKKEAFQPDTVLPNDEPVDDATVAPVNWSQVYWSDVDWGR